MKQKYVYATYKYVQPVTKNACMFSGRAQQNKTKYTVEAERESNN